MVFTSGEFDYNSSTTWPTRIYNVVHQYDDNITVVDGLLRFYDKFSIDIYNTNTPESALVYDSDSSRQYLSGMGYFAGSGSCIYNLALTDNVFYFFGKRKNYQEASFILACLKHGDSYLVGCYGGRNWGYNDFNNITLYDAIHTNRGPHSIRKIVDYELMAPKIAYFNKLLIANSSNDTEMNDDMFSCSNVTLGSTITIDGKNYYAIGENILLPLDS